MKNLKNFRDFIFEGKTYESETILIDPESISSYGPLTSLLEAKKPYIDKKELADEVRKALGEAETRYIRVQGNPQREVKTITSKLGLLIINMIRAIAYGEFRSRWSNLNDEQFNDVMMDTLRHVLQDWHKSVDKPNMTDEQIYANLRTLVKTRLKVSNNDLLRRVLREPLLHGKKLTDYDAIDRTIDKLLTGTTGRLERPAVKAPEPGEKSWFDYPTSQD